MNEAAVNRRRAVSPPTSSSTVTIRPRVPRNTRVENLFYIEGGEARTCYWFCAVIHAGSVVPRPRPCGPPAGRCGAIGGGAPQPPC